MAQFIAFSPDVEVNGQTVLTTINSFPDFMKRMATKELAKHGIENPLPENWYSQVAWLDSFKDISEKYGPNTLFNIGKSIPENAQFPPEISDIEKALAAIDVAYHMNHRNGDIGFYKLTNHNTATRTLIMQCKNPYPCDFDRGLIIAMARKFESTATIELDASMESRLDGGEESWYQVKY